MNPLQQDSLLRALNEDLFGSEEEELFDTPGSGSAVWDFLGQAAWGVADTASFSVLGARDVFGEARKGDNYEGWEEMIAGSAAGDWDELSNWGKAGYSVGTAIGLLPSLGISGFVGKGGVRALSKIGEGGLKLATSKASKELVERAANIAVTKGPKAIKSANIGDDAAREIIKEGFEIQRAAKDILKLEGGMVGEAYEQILASSLKPKLASVLNIADDQAQALSVEAMKIILKNNPDDAFNFLQMLTQKIPGFRGERMSRIVAAMGLDAAIGFVMGTQRAISQQFIKSQLGVERDHFTGEFTYTGDHNVNPWDAGGEWLSEAGTTAWHFSLIGPVKYFKGWGGTSASHGRRLMQINSSMIKSLKPIGKMNNEQLRAQIAGINEISGGYLTRTFKGKGYPHHQNWWLEAKSDADTKILRNFLSDIRSQFLKNAHFEWAKEFGVDAALSIPRMAAGVMAMHAPGMIHNFHNYGFSRDSLFNAFGQSSEEKIANIFTAMYFTRRPHSFHTEATGPMFSKFFNTGELPMYLDAKASKLRKIIGGLNTFGADISTLNKVVNAYGDKSDFSANVIEGNVDKSINRYINNTPEFSRLSEIFSAYSKSKNEPGSTTLSDAYNRKIVEMVEQKKITLEESRAMYERLFVAEEILKLYHENSGVDLATDTYNPNQALDIVNKIATMKLNNKVVTALNVESELSSFMETAVNNASLPVTRILKNYILETYKALGFEDIDIDPVSGKIIIPRVTNQISDVDVRSALATVIDRGIKNNWIEQRTPLSGELTAFSSDQLGKIREIYINSSENMMSHAWGDNWKGNVQFDPLILENNAWHFPYNDLLKVRRHINAYKILRGETDHNLDPGEAQKFEDALNTFLRYKKAPTVKDVDGKNNPIDKIEYGETKEFIDNLHNIVKLIEPNALDDKPQFMTYRQASNLKELVSGSEGYGGLFGDLFTNTKSLSDLNNFILNKAIRNLSGYNLDTGIDIKASLITLIADPNFNYSKKSIPVMPSYEVIKSALGAAVGKTITRETYNELLAHYKNLVTTVDASSFPVDFRKDLVEFRQEDWINSLKISMHQGQQSMDAFAMDRAHTMSAYLDTEISRQEMYLKGLKLGVNVVDKSVMNKFDKEIQEFVDMRDATIRLKEMVKVALLEKNPYKLSALAKHEGNIENVIKTLRSQAVQTTREQYLLEISEIIKKVETAAQRRAMSESQVMDLLREDISSFAKDLPPKDVQDKILRITVSQFAVKYGISHKDLENIFSIDKLMNRDKNDIEQFVRNILGDFYDNPSQVRDIADIRVINDIKTNLLGLAKQIQFDPNTKQGLDNFRTFVIKPLEISMKEAMLKIKNPIDRPSDADVFTDLYTITSNYFSKRIVKSLKIDARQGMEVLFQGERMIGETKDRGLGAILEALDPSQNYIYLAESGGTDANGMVIRDINTRQITEINALLNSGKFSIINPKGVQDWYNSSDKHQLNNVNRNRANLSERYQVIPINESVSLIVRMDKVHNGSIHKEIQRQFRSPNDLIGDKGGELYRMLEAIYDGDLNLNTPKHAAIRELIKDLQNAKSDNDVIQGIKLTRMLYNMPGFIDKVLKGKNIDLDNALILDINKRDKLTETKNGYVPTKENRARTNDLYKNSDSPLHREAYGRIKEWLENPEKKLKIASFNDEGKILDKNGNEVLDKNGNPMVNIFDAAARAKAKLQEQLDAKEIDQVDFDLAIKMFEKDFKSIVDGEFFLASDPYLAFMSMIGLHQDMVHTNSNGEIIGFKSGGIKPTISQSSIDFLDKSSANYGRIEQFFAKTAFKYNPLLNQLMLDLGVDAITFGSANKINTLKSGINAESRDRFSTINGVSEKDLKKLNMPWDEFLNDPKNRNLIEVIEVPLESMSLRTVSREHDPLVGQNAGVHMSHDNGIASWIGLNSKLDTYSRNLYNMYTNPLHRTALAQQVLGARALDGDPSIVNSAISSIITREGLILEPWAQRRLEDNMIGYFLNNGGVAGGVVKDGSLDVMTADMGNLRPTIRSNVDGRKTVRYFGEFLPSYYASQKDFIKYGDPSGVHSIIIQKLTMTSKDGKFRSADGFLVRIEKDKFLQIEGQYIDKEGNLRSADQSDIVIESNNVANKKLYDQAIKIEEMVYKEIAKYEALEGKGPTIADVAFITRNISKDMSVGAINSRQPRNMMGDIVINRIGFGTDGNPYVPKEAGNVSRINFLDAIKPQDADFDFDKSFNYIAAPGQFWRESNKLAGDIVTASTPETLNRLFDPNIAVNMYAKSIADMLGPDATYSQIQREVDMSRGRFIKMHQTATYLANIFRGDNLVLEFQGGDVTGQRKSMQIRLSPKGKQITTVNNIAKLAEQFIDLYKNLPSEYTKDRVFDLQQEVWFGKNGLFEVGFINIKEGGKFTVLPDHTLMGSQYNKVRNAINKRWILPINEYIKYNQGYTTDVTGNQQKARLGDYHNAFVQLAEKSLNISSREHLTDDMIAHGLEQSARYFTSVSANPYDIAMREMHKIYLKETNIKEQGRQGPQKSESQDIIDYIEGGYDKVYPGETREVKYNRVFNQALKDYVKDEARILRLVDLQKREQALILEIDSKKAFSRNSTEDTIEVTLLKQKLNRVSELKTHMEEAISYQFKDNLNVEPMVRYKNSEFNKGVLRNPFDKPLVVIDAKGNIKEVISPGRSNINKIWANEKIIENGRRFEITDGLNQEGLRVLFQAFSGLPRIKVGRGKNAEWVNLNEYEIQHYILTNYKKLQAEVIDLRNRSNMQTVQDKVNFNRERDQLMYDFLFSPNNSVFLENPAYRKALILRMLTPNVSDKKVSVRSTNRLAGKSAVYDYIYGENMFSEPIMSLLAKISSGERGGDKALAIEILNDINYMKNAAYTQVRNPNIDVELIKSRMYTEPASLKGYMTDTKHLDQRIFELRNSQDKIVKNAAQIMIDYAQGKGIVDPVVLYKASVVMNENNIDFRRQWGRIKYLSNSDGTLTNFGFDRIFISEAEAMNAKNLGERSGIMESTSERVNNLFECYLK